MKSNLALALAGAAMFALPAAAQTTPPIDTPPKTIAPKAAGASMFEMKAGQWRATKLAGVAVYNSNNEKIGDINELILARDGRVAAVVIGVGGFLGMGEHLAAVPFDQVRWMDQPRDATVGSRSTTTTTTTGSGTSSVTVDSPAAGSGTTTLADRAPTRDPYRGYPDHAVVDMTKEQLKALPEVKYSR